MKIMLQFTTPTHSEISLIPFNDGNVQWKNFKCKKIMFIHSHHNIKMNG